MPSSDSLLGVSQPKTFVYMSPAENFMRRERWIFDSRGEIWALIIHRLGPPLFLLRCSEAMLAFWNEGVAKGSYQKNTPLGVKLDPALYRLQISLFTN